MGWLTNLKVLLSDNTDLIIRLNKVEKKLAHIDTTLLDVLDGYQKAVTTINKRNKMRDVRETINTHGEDEFAPLWVIADGMYKQMKEGL